MQSFVQTFSQPGGRPFFFGMTLVLIAIVIAGFSVAGFARPGGPLAVPLFLHFHGAVFLGWFVLLAVQARLPGAGHLALHKRLGQVSVGLALAIIVVGYLVISHAVAKPDMTIAGRPAVIGAVFPVFDIINFTICYALGLANRAKPQAHKRFMLLAALMMIDPAMARLVFGTGLPGTLIVWFELTLYAAIFVYDFSKLRRPHWASLVGLALFISAFVFKKNVEAFAWWPEMIRAVF